MEIPLQITFRHIPHSEAIETHIREKAEKLNQFFDRITSCRVMVEAPHRHGHKGKIFHIRIDMTLPGGKELVVNRDPGENHAHEDVYVAIRDAFKALKRQLQDHVRRNYQSQVKAHEAPKQSGKVSRLFPMENYGYLKSEEGEEIYFHRNSVLDEAFDRLDIDSEVYFVREKGDKGPQATSVKLLR